MREMKAYGRYFYPLQPLTKNKVYFFSAVPHTCTYGPGQSKRKFWFSEKALDQNFRNLFALLYPFYDHFAGGNDNTFADKHTC